MMNKRILEVCVDSVESALAAARGGADRLELCGSLVVGGTTPSPALFGQIRKYTDIRIHALLRPRFGDFCYTEYEFNILREEVSMYRELGAEGIVIGILNPDGTLNLEQMKILIEEAGQMSVTLHRAFDVCADPIRTLEEAKELGVHTILTSGQKNTCLAGKELIRELVCAADGQIEILAGGGVNAEVIPELLEYTGAYAYHMSGKHTLDSAMEFRKKGVNMGLPSLSEYEIWRTSEEEVRKAKEQLQKNGAAL